MISVTHKLLTWPNLVTHHTPHSTLGVLLTLKLKHPASASLMVMPSEIAVPRPHLRNLLVYHKAPTLQLKPDTEVLILKPNKQANKHYPVLSCWEEWACEVTKRVLRGCSDADARGLPLLVSFLTTLTNHFAHQLLLNLTLCKS